MRLRVTSRGSCPSGQSFWRRPTSNANRNSLSEFGPSPLPTKNANFGRSLLPATNTKIRKHVTSIEELIHGTQQPLSRLRITLWGSRCRRGPRAWRPLLPARPLRRWWAPAWLRAGRPAHMSGRTATFGPLACLLFGGQRLRLRHGATRSGLYVGVWPVWSYLAAPQQTCALWSRLSFRGARSQNFSEHAPPTVKVLARSHRRLPHTHSRLFLSPRRDVPCVLGSHHSQMTSTG